LVVPDIASAFFTSLIQAFERALNEVGMGLLLTDAQLSIPQELRCVRDLIDRQVDGLIISPCDLQGSKAAVEEAMKWVPVVQADRYCTNKAPRVITDAQATIELAISHLQSSGYSTIAFVGASTTASTARDRELAFKRQAARLDPLAPERILKGSFTVEWGREAAEILTNRWPEVDAVVCANDLIAVGLLQGLRDLGRSVPSEIGVTGCDDTLYAKVSQPTLTTVTQPLDLIAAAAVELIGRHDGQPSVTKLRPTLRIGESTGSAGDPPGRGRKTGAIAS
jgi:LacI family transcriptional regulator